MESKKFDLSGKNILVTGASSGIGKQAAIDIAKNGANCIITGRDTARLQETFDELKSGNHQLFVADLTEDEKVDFLANQIEKLDGIVHCAGIFEYIPAQFINEKNIDNLIKINFRAPVLLTSKLLRKKKIKKNGSLVFLSSLASKGPSFGSAMYTSTKKALEGYSKLLALELGPKGIRSNAILPNFVKTKMVDEALDIVSEDVADKHKKELLIGFGMPEDVSNLIIFLLSDESRWITGQEITMGSL